MDEEKEFEEESSAKEEGTEETEETEIVETEEIEEVSVEDFLKLPEAVSGRARMVDYDAVTKEILGNPVSVKHVGELMMKHSSGKNTVYASEVTRFLSSLVKKGYEVVLKTKEGKRWVLVRKKSK
jgi:hypothetical protein